MSLATRELVDRPIRELSGAGGSEGFVDRIAVTRRPPTESSAVRKAASLDEVADCELFGDILVFEGPAGGYRPDLTADWHLMIGDESALPAIAASLEVLPRTARVVVRIICDGAAYEVPLQTPIDADVQWIHRAGDAADSDLLAASVSEVDFPRGRVHGFIHGEAAEIRQIRRHLLGERGLARGDMSCSPYWRHGMVDEAWRSIKADFVRAMDAGLTA